MEAHIFPLNVNLDDRDAAFNQGFFEGTSNRLGEFMEADEALMGQGGAVGRRNNLSLYLGDFAPFLV